MCVHVYVLKHLIYRVFLPLQSGAHHRQILDSVVNNLNNASIIERKKLVRPSGGSRGKSGHGPPSKLSMEFPPRGRKNNDSIGLLRIWRNVRILAPAIDVGYGFGPPVRKNATLKH